MGRLELEFERQEYINRIESAYRAINSRIGDFAPEIGIILGTGLGKLAEKVNLYQEIKYEDIPYFPVSTVESHAGRLLFGTLGGKKVVVMQGRFHFYEGYSAKEITLPVRVMKKLGIRYLFISNAAGGLNPQFEVGDLMIIRDHINLIPDNPLRGLNLDEFGPRFPDMSEPYDTELINKALDLGKKMGLRIHAGVYVAVAGPNLETRAEYLFLRRIGADAVGMSTVPEVIVARHMGVKVFGLSVITDIGFPIEAVEEVNLEKVIAAASKAEPALAELVERIIEEL